MSAHPQCKLCSKGVDIEPGLSVSEIARKYGVHRRSVDRHLAHIGDVKNNTTAQQSVVSTSSETLSAKSRTVLDIKGDEGTAEVGVNVDLDEFFRERGIDPTTVEVTSRKIGEWQVRTSEGIQTLKSQKIGFHIRKVSQQIDIPSLFDSINRARQTRPLYETREGKGNRKGLVVVWADPQTGKVDRNGGTPALINRLYDKRDALRAYIKRHPSNSAHFLNLGDSVENIENTGSQLATNDLSLQDQIALETTFEHEFIEVLAESHDSVSVAIVPSNHCQLRKGKQLIGRPGDDWGIHIAGQLEERFKMAPDLYSHVTFNYPEDKWTESMVVDVEGTKIGMVHGHQKTQPNAIPGWWAGQVHGAILAEAEILLTGHFHHFLARQTGVNIFTGRDKYHLQAPALDNGSAWYQNVSGESSKPGLMVFQVDENGFDLESLAIL